MRAIAVAAGLALGAAAGALADGYTTVMIDVRSDGMDSDVPASVLLPPGFDPEAAPLPLVIWLHGGGGDRGQLPQYAPWIDALHAEGAIPPMVFASFTSTPFSGFLGPWEDFIGDDLPGAMAARFGVDAGPRALTIAGISMGGYGALKSAFRNPGAYVAVGAMEPSVEPTLTTLPNFTRNTWSRGAAESLSPADNPARLAHDNAPLIRASGLAIYLEAGDEDYLGLHDGTEFLHRVLWDHDIRHEYHLVRWADHVGASLQRRFREMMTFLATALAGGRKDPVVLPLTSDEREMLAGALAGDETAAGALTAYFSGPRGPSVHAGFWLALKQAAAADPDMHRAYARLPPTSLEGDEPGAREDP